MALSRCNKCGLLTEHEHDIINTQVVCPRCETVATVYDSVFFVGKLLEQFYAQRKELLALRAAAAPAVADSALLAPSETFAVASDSFDIHNCDQLSSPEQHQGVVAWFRRKQISAGINVNAVDTTGFFDEAAIAIGSHYELLGEVCERIRFAQHKEFNSALIHLDKKTPDQAQALEAFGRQLYQYSLVARCFVNKAEKNLRLVLQNAPGVRRFFAGEWLEWYALLVALRICADRRITYSCARNLTLSFGSDDEREVDVFFLLGNDRPLFIECKTGEFRQDLDKYIALRKRLGIDAKNFVICVADMQSEQAKGLSTMYEMTFVNTHTLGPHLATLM